LILWAKIDERKVPWEMTLMPKLLEQRLADLEAEVERLKIKVDKPSPDKPWWEEIAGTFADSPDYEEAMRLGREYRTSVTEMVLADAVGARMSYHEIVR
jgi:hypothetical protein